MVLPAAAALVKQLRAPSEDARIAALALAAGLLSTPGGDPIEKHYPQLFAAFLSRADDVKVRRAPKDCPYDNCSGYTCVHWLSTLLL